VKDKLFWALAFVVFLIFAFLIDEPHNPAFLPSAAIRVLLAANLTLFLFLLNKFVGQPINETLKTRGEDVKANLAEARDKLAEADKLRAEVSERLAKVEAEVVEMQERAEALGKSEAEKIDTQAREDEARFMHRVDDQIARRQAETRQQLAKDTAALTAQLTKELLAETMTDEDQQRVLTRSLGALENLPDKE
jgi:F-type H+-transporting ATPase subunit b